MTLKRWASPFQLLGAADQSKLRPWCGGINSSGCCEGGSEPVLCGYMPVLGGDGDCPVATASVTVDVPLIRCHTAVDAGNAGVLSIGWD